MNRSRFRWGFTLVELMVVIAILGILALLALPCLVRAQQKARWVEEMSAGRQLMVAVHLYGDDRDGELLPGYVSDDAMVDDRGQRIGFPVNARYPWRIIPYLSGSMELLYSGKNRARLASMRSGNHADYVYSASAFPSLGINAYFIGGNQSEFPAADAERRFGAGTVVTKLSAVRRPGVLMNFSSARSATGGGHADGYFQVTPPFLGRRQWAAAYSPLMAPSHWGFVAPRFNNRAVASMVDGHVESLTPAQLEDMQHWCNRADRPDYVLSPAP